MNLVIDVGNTKVKFGVFDKFKLKNIYTCVLSDFDDTLGLISKHHPGIHSTLIASVGNLDSEQILSLKENFSFMILDGLTKVPFINKYETPHTLGVDRIALVSAAAMTFPNENVLVIDMGTSITYDFLSSENEYLGGAISPGIRMRYRALHNYTAKLPLLNSEIPDSFIGNNTANAIHSGVIYGVINEIHGFIEDYKEKFGGLTLILTGGDAEFLRDNLKNDIFAVPNFLLEGLNFILEHNKL